MPDLPAFDFNRNMRISVAIVEDNRSFRDKLADYLNETPNFNCACTCETAEDALKIIPRQGPDVVLMDLHLPKMSGVDCIRRLKELCPSVRILVLTVYEDNDRIFGALKAGASGYLLKRTDPTDILRAIQEVCEGGAPMSSQIACRVVESFRETVRNPLKDEKLTQRENEILQQLSKGYLSKEIAGHLSISVTTVNTHLHHIYDKLHARCRAEAILKFLG
jgi:DNA-binding NarL/FixJ family response regulator